MTDRFYKVLTEDYRSLRTRLLQWPLPTYADGDWHPGEWVAVEGELVECSNGIHVTCWHGIWNKWLTDLNNTVWEVEVDGDVASVYLFRGRYILITPQPDEWRGYKLAVRRARLLRPVPFPPLIQRVADAARTWKRGEWMKASREESLEPASLFHASCETQLKSFLYEIEEVIMEYYFLSGLRAVYNATWKTVSRNVPYSFSEMADRVMFVSSLLCGILPEHLAQMTTESERMVLSALGDALRHGLVPIGMRGDDLVVIPYSRVISGDELRMYKWSGNRADTVGHGV